MESLTVEHVLAPQNALSGGNWNGVIVPSVSCIEQTVDASGVLTGKTDKQSSGNKVRNAADQS